MDEQNQVLGNDVQSLGQQNQSPEVAEKMLRQSEVNDLVGHKKREAYEKGKNDALAELQMRQAAVQQHTPTVTAHPMMGGGTGMDAESVRRMVAEETQRQQREAVGNQIASDFMNKMNAVKSKYADFDDVVGPLMNHLHEIPHVVLMANAADNTGDVMYDLLKNRHKLASLHTLTQMSPQIAQAEMNKLSHSIKQNEAASNVPNIDEPLSQIKPSVKGMDNGSMSIADRRNQDYLRA